MSLQAQVVFVPTCRSPSQTGINDSPPGPDTFKAGATNGEREVMEPSSEKLQFLPRPPPPPTTNNNKKRQGTCVAAGVHAVEAVADQSQ
ncbi:hypothetical protein C0Q70_06194 [Pomacea canaliculata]|uniref:Uncharacterized protein n=1 Tax=Pomacea canaliculata TaxID=400727 RepID=A0A2T7PNB5_POMCA|nr:hypothetical protein C0Q70_06194 [Pomacea canaliculata]